MQKNNLKKKIFSLSFFALLLLTFFTSSCSLGINGDAASKKAEKYLNTYILRNTGGITAKAAGVDKKDEFYEVQIQILKDNQVMEKVPVLVTKTGKTLILNPQQTLIYNLDVSPEDAFLKASKEAQTKMLKNIPKKDKVEVKLFVMSGCPFGVEAENTFYKVINHLGKDIKDLDIQVKYITSKVKLENKNPKYCIENYCAMHGLAEIKENLRQICVANTDKDKFWDYLAEFNSKCKLDEKAESCANEIIKAKAIDAQKIVDCMKAPVDLFEKDFQESTKYEATASPTVIINGAKYEGMRTPNAILEAMCAGYKNAPAICKQKIKDGDKIPEAGNASCGASPAPVAVPTKDAPETK